MESRKHTWSYLPNDTKNQGGLEKVGFLFLIVTLPVSLSSQNIYSPWGSELPNWLFKAAGRKLQKPKSPRNVSQYWSTQQMTPRMSIQCSVGDSSL